MDKIHVCTIASMFPYISITDVHVSIIDVDISISVSIIDIDVSITGVPSMSMFRSTFGGLGTECARMT